MTTDTMLATETFAERERLAHLLAGLTPEQWSAPSLCTGWRVREVVAHITTAYRLAPKAFMDGLARENFDFDRFADRQARADTDALSDADLLASLRENVRHPWQPPGGGQAGALSHDVIHGLDITEALGLPAVPPERIALVLGNAGEKNLEYFGVNLDGLRLVATDYEVSLGEGDPVELPVKDVLLTVTGRRPVPTPRGA
ncbi:maleylpyruvate isomerase family mycothiol-dependent enzyme [Georgenia deserti]|uniref:Maleylpyruvate isomerase family mycothiol-dependent enzyme n=1 Tax=Georgenia deserti TaxID=2093781 RepID=A0ABW4L9D0_9MICO